ncbi:hypothetical protein JOM56_000743 [Amanita muscaria]
MVGENRWCKPPIVPNLSPTPELEFYLFCAITIGGKRREVKGKDVKEVTRDSALLVLNHHHEQRTVFSVPSPCRKWSKYQYWELVWWGTVTLSRTQVEKLKNIKNGWILLSPDSSINHNSACPKRHRDTGKWLLDLPLYKNWKTMTNSFLWLHGLSVVTPLAAGSGKTILCSKAL